MDGLRQDGLNYLLNIIMKSTKKLCRDGLPDGLWMDTRFKILWRMKGKEAVVINSMLDPADVGHTTSNDLWAFENGWVNWPIKAYYETL